ncbi:MAG: hypothetical protein ACFE9Z_06590 [Promethearchaeota archaeon]
MIKVSLNENMKIHSNKIGIDMGQTLSKLVYLDNNEIILNSFPTSESISIIKNFLDSKKEKVSNICFTGGKCFPLYQEFSKKTDSILIDEFEANAKGVEFLYRLEKNKDLSRSLIVTIGTGTSILLKDREFEHIGGSALGGGFFMGIMKLISGEQDFHKAVNLAKKGVRYNLDLKVSDIYEPEDTRVDLLFREFTAASLGKITKNFNMKNLKLEDFLNSFICLIGENLGTIAILMASNRNVTEIVFSGGFLRDNKVLQKILFMMCKINQKKAIFLKNSEFSAAIGAMII